MQTTKLQADAIIGGKRYPAGADVTAKPEAIALGIQRAAKADIRAQIEARAGDALSLLGTQADVLGIVLMHSLPSAHRHRLSRRGPVVAHSVLAGSSPASKALSWSIAARAVSSPTTAP